MKIKFYNVTKKHPWSATYLKTIIKSRSNTKTHARISEANS